MPPIKTDSEHQSYSFSCLSNAFRIDFANTGAGILDCVALLYLKLDTAAAAARYRCLVLLATKTVS